MRQRNEMQPTVVLAESASGLGERALAEFVIKACRVAGVSGAVTVLITNNRNIRALNTRYRGKQSATDVLSFPAAGLTRDFAGDIAVSLDLAKRNAQVLGHSVATEVRILILHGILHLAGYDHEQDDGEMARHELRLRRKLALPSALIERASARGMRSTPPRR